MWTETKRLGYFTLLVGALCLTASLGARPQRAAQNAVVNPTSLVGVWEQFEILIEPDATSPHPEMRSGPSRGVELLFVAKSHYSHISLQSKEPRTPLPASDPTVEQLMAAWGPFGAHAGTYELVDGVFTMHPTIGKDPRITATTEFKLAVRIDAGILSMTSIGGLLGKGITIKYRRIE